MGCYSQDAKYTTICLMGDILGGVQRKMISAPTENGKKVLTMTKHELVREAINFAMSALCDGYLDMPCGCDGCTLCDIDTIDDDGNPDCRKRVFEEFVANHKSEFVGGADNGLYRT